MTGRGGDRVDDDAGLEEEEEEKEEEGLDDDHDDDDDDRQNDESTTQVVVTCEEQSDDGSFMKQFAVFRSGITFGQSTGISRSNQTKREMSPNEVDIPASNTSGITAKGLPIVGTDPRTPIMPPSIPHHQQQQQQQAPIDSHGMPSPALILTLGDPELLGNLHSIREEAEEAVKEKEDEEEGEVQSHRGDTFEQTKEGSPSASAFGFASVANEGDTDSQSIASSQKYSRTSDLGMGSHGLNSMMFFQHDNDTSRHHDDDYDDDMYTRTAAPDSMFRRYKVDVVRYDHDRAADIPLLSMARPHMRAFHLAWMAFFVSFFAWFAMTPLLSEIALSLDFTRKEIFTSSVFAVLSSAVTRLWIGPLNDLYGARWVMCWTLVAVAIPTLLSTFLLQGTTSLYLLRLFIGTAGSCFVTAQYWTLSMFTHEISGTANALVAGWGNLGGGVAQVVMGSVLFPLAKLMYGGSGFGSSSALDVWRNEDKDDHYENNDDDDDGDMAEYDRPSELAWRTVLAFPGLLCLVMAYAVVRFGDDTPKGNVSRCRDDSPEHNPNARINPWKTFRTAIWNRNTLLLSVQYGCCFGVEITMTQAAALYFKEEFGQSTENAAALASVFGWLNVFARGFGGFGSDYINSHYGMRGRLWYQVICLVLEGGLVVLFGYSRTLYGAMIVLVFFSIAVQAAEGSTYGIVPYVDSSVLGSVAGVVGSGGNIGGALFVFVFANYDYRTSFFVMGCTVFASAFWTLFIKIDGHCGLVAGKDSSLIVQRRQQAKPPAIIMIPLGSLDSHSACN